VQRVHSTIHKIQHGKLPEYYAGGAKIDEAKAGPSFFRLFLEELKTGHRPQVPPKSGLPAIIPKTTETTKR
jgi:hypothetical protein